jgi:hypothetical protein
LAWKKSGQIIGRHCLQFLYLFFASIPVNLWQLTYSKDDRHFLVLLQAFINDQFPLLISKAKLSRSFNDAWQCTEGPSSCKCHLASINKKI